MAKTASDNLINMAHMIRRVDGAGAARAPGRAYFLRLAADFFVADFLARGTLPPARRASDRPIAIACFRLLTGFPDRPLFSVPRFLSCIAFSTFSEASSPYFAIIVLLG
jgi:hypothetical protein